MKPRLLLFFFFLSLSQLGVSQNSALSFNGVDEYLSVSHNDGYNIGDGFTLEAWILAETWADQIWQGSIINKDNQGPDRGFAFRCGANGSLSLVMAVDNVWNEAFSGPVMNTNQWHHVAAVVDQGTITLYVDGQQVAQNTFSGTPSASSDMNINIGASPGFGGRFFHGVIDEVRIWNKARSQSEIADNATVDLSGSEDGLITYYPMNEGSGASAGDIASASNNASLVEMDDSNWVDGYTLPDFDVSVQRVYGVDVVNMVDRPVKIKVDLQNTGTMAIGDISLALSVDGELYVTEMISQNIAPKELYTYTFELPVDLTGLSDPLIEVEASQAEDGNSLNNSGSLTIKSGSKSNVIVSDKTLHKNGKLNNTFNLTLPRDLHRYEQILLNIDLTCPSGGCGDWDVLSDLKATSDMGTFEIARYITPYGIACGGWQVDITDFKSVLGGEVSFYSTVLVYTERGWLLDLSIDLIDNDPASEYQHLSTLWEKEYQVYGDPGISYDLDPVSLDINQNTETSHMRMTITGHGQGNTQNAAEFFEINNSVQVNGQEIAVHNLWKDDCATNPCENQAGTWLFSRAGWCPGQDVRPYVVNTTASASPGSTISMDYVLQSYTNLLNTGYNNSGHTEPYHRIYGYFIESSSTPFEDFTNLRVEDVVAAQSGNMLQSVDFNISNNGTTTIQDFAYSVYYNGQKVGTMLMSDALLPGTSASLTHDLNIPLVDGAEESLFVEVMAQEDQNPGDNVAKTQLAVNTQEILAEHPFEVFPNPSYDGHFQFAYDPFWAGNWLEVYHVSGKLVQRVLLQGQVTGVNLDGSGLYIYKLLKSEDSVLLSGKLSFIEQ